MSASTQLARALLGLGDVAAARSPAIEALQVARRLRNVAAARSSAIEALQVARRLRNVSAMSYALELWATAELRDGRIERAGHLYALADSSWPVGYRVWPTDAEEHRTLDTELRTALGDRYEQMFAQARTAGLDRAVDELIESDPAAARSAVNEDLSIAESTSSTM